MKEVEKAYCAATIDCEGTISISHKSKLSQKRNVSKTIRVTNTNILLLEWLKAVTNLGKVSLLSTKSTFFDRRCKPLYGWTLCGKSIKSFLIEIMPYLILKRRQAELMLESIELSWHRGKGKEYSQEIWQRQIEIKSELNKLNHVGL